MVPTLSLYKAGCFLSIVNPQLAWSIIWHHWCLSLLSYVTQWMVPEVIGVTGRISLLSGERSTPCITRVLFPSIVLCIHFIQSVHVDSLQCYIYLWFYCSYIHTLPQTLGNVYDELMQPLPSALEAILSPDNSADQSVFSKSLMEAELEKSVATPSSQPPSMSGLAPNSNDLTTNRAR